MEKRIFYAIIAVLLVQGCDNKQDKSQNKEVYVQASNQIEAGRYLIAAAGCNDCHTDGFIQNPNIPESEWLTGSSTGWLGTWGTTYPANLRLSVQNMTEEQWVEMLKTRQGLPPMPWSSVNHLSENDSRAVYAYIKSLGPKGVRAPVTVAPGIEPITPYFSLAPQNMPASVATN